MTQHERTVSPACSTEHSDAHRAESAGHRRVVQWLLSDDAKGYGISLLFHSLLLLVLSLIVIHSAKNTQPFSTLFSESKEEGIEIDGPLDAQIKLADTPPEGANLPQFQQVPLPANPAARSVVPTELDQNIAQIVGKQQESVDTGAGFQMPGAGRFVKRGSFAAWTVPHDPEPGEDYLIIIQVKIPSRLRNYSSRDLTGYMRGTDGYRTPIGFKDGRYYGKFNLRAKQLAIRIPGAAANVRDTIHVASRLLREKQDLEIVF